MHHLSWTVSIYIGSSRTRTVSKVTLLAIIPKISYFRNGLHYQMWYGLAYLACRGPWAWSSAQYGAMLITPEFEKIRISRSSLAILQFWALLGPQEPLSLKGSLGARGIKYQIPDFVHIFSLSYTSFYSPVPLYSTHMDTITYISLTSYFTWAVFGKCLWAPLLPLPAPQTSSWKWLLLKWRLGVLVTFLLLW